MNKMNTLFLALLLMSVIMPFANSIEVNKIAENIDSTNKEINDLKKEVNNKYSLIEKKLGEVPTQKEVSQLLQLHLEKVNEIMDHFRTLLIVSIIVIAGAFMGIGYSIYFYYKGQGRL